MLNKKRIIETMLPCFMVATMCMPLTGCQNTTTASDTDKVTETSKAKDNTGKTETAKNDNEKQNDAKAKDKTDTSKTTVVENVTKSDNTQKSTATNSMSNATSSNKTASNSASNTSNSSKTSSSSSSASSSTPSQSNSSNSGGGSSTTPAPAPAQPSQPAHTHNFNEPIYGTVHHDATGHWTTVVTGQTWVVDQAAYDEPVYAGANICNVCGWWSTGSAGLMVDHIDIEHDGAANYYCDRIQVDTIHHDEVGHYVDVTEDQWVQDSAAWDEDVITGYRCSCGAVQ